MSDNASNKQSSDSKLFAELRSLRAQNDHLKALLAQNGIAWKEDVPETIVAETPPQPSTIPGQLSTAEKVRLFRRLFQGREDVYPIRWESSAKGTSGYAPACGNDKFARTANLHGAAARRARATDGPSEWKPGVCKKPRIKCANCEQRLLLTVTDQVIFDHLSGHHTIGVSRIRTPYPTKAVLET